MIRAGIENVLSRRGDIEIVFACETIKEAFHFMKSNLADVLLLDLHKYNIEELELISELRASGKIIKSIMMDFNADNELFIMALKCDVQGYVLGKSSQEEILYAIDQVYKGKRYLDFYFVNLIANAFFISENTVKKQSSHIYGRLNIRENAQVVRFQFPRLL